MITDYFESVSADLLILKMQKKTKQAMLIVCPILFVYGIYWYDNWQARVEMLRWISERQRALNAIGERVIAYSSKNDNRLPPEPEDYVLNGLLAPSEMEFKDSLLGIKIKRAIRPIPNTRFPPELILIVESYDPQGDHCIILSLNGRSTIVYDLSGALRRDNKLRNECGLLSLQ